MLDGGGEGGLWSGVEGDVEVDSCCAWVISDG